MPTVFSHAIAAAALGRWFPDGGLPRRFWMLTVVCAMLPDVDIVGFAVGIRYEEMLGHRGLTHSLAFAAVVGFMAAHVFSNTPIPRTGPSRLQLFLWFAAITASHGVLDALTNGGRGIAFLAPFSNDRFFFPWRPIQVSPIGVRFFSARGVEVLASESRWILLPSAIIAMLGSAIVRGRRRSGFESGRHAGSRSVESRNRPAL